MANFAKRRFLKQALGGGAGALLHQIPGLSFQTDAQTAENEVPFHPSDPEPSPLDAMAAKIQAGSDEFLTERFHDRIAAVLTGWASDLLTWPSSLESVARSLHPTFRGASQKPEQSIDLRSGPALRTSRAIFPKSVELERGDFLRILREGLRDFPSILLAELQIVEIDIPVAGTLRTSVRYELCGSAKNAHREQRIGHWNLEWVSLAENWLVQKWTAGEESRAVAAAPLFADITAAALKGAASYESQLLHGVDYWRTVLDSACGIDIYGHNGIAAGDFEGTGRDGIYVCQPGGLPNRLYRNRGDGTFEDVTERAGVGILDNTACALFADFRNIGRQDLLVVRAAGPSLYLNDGGRFHLKNDAFQFAQPPQGTFTGAAAADYNRDGSLDIYFCLYTYYQGAGQYRFPVPYYSAENGPPNFLMRNNGDGTFRDATREAGLTVNNKRFSFCCAWNDYDGNGWPDLYVANDFGPKNMYRNNGDGTFTDLANRLGVEDIGAGMSASWFDADGDGREDLYVADMWTAAGRRISEQPLFQNKSPEDIRALYRKHAMGNSLFLNRQESFQDKTAQAGVAMGRWSWSSDAWDFDHDGLPDLYVVNGMISGPRKNDLNSFFWRQVVANSPDGVGNSEEYEQGWNALNEFIRADCSWSGFERNVFYANNGDGTFTDISFVSGLDFIEDSRAFSLADIDGDGSLEVLLKSRSAPQLRVLKNIMPALPPSIAIRLRGTKSNRDAIGAIVTIESGTRRQARSLQAGSGFLSQHSKEMIFAAPVAENDPVRVRVLWPSGLQQHVDNLAPNTRVWIEEGSNHVRTEPLQPSRPHTAISGAPSGEKLPRSVQTWLLEPITAPDVSLPGPRRLSDWRGTKILLAFAPPTFTLNSGAGFELLRINPADAHESAPEAAGVFNLLYRFLFDRHRDLSLPVSFLIDENGKIIKIYRGPITTRQVELDARRAPRNRAERMTAALPFAGDSESFLSSRNYLAAGSIFYQRGYHAPAALFFREALRDNPDSAEAYYGLGSAHLKQNQLAQARAAFEEALKRNPAYPGTESNSWNNLGLLEARQGASEKAIDCFHKALTADPGSFVVLQNLGNACRQAGRWTEARESLERAIALKPNNAEANYGLAMVYAQTNDAARAESLLERALAANPGYPEALNNIGILYLRTGRRDLGVAKFEECIRVAPQFDQAYLNLARVYAMEGNQEQARSALRKLLALQPGNRAALSEIEQLR